MPQCNLISYQRVTAQMSAQFANDEREPLVLEASIFHRFVYESQYQRSDPHH